MIISAEYKISNCYVCNDDISFSNFHCGHIISHANGGETIIDNLKPICMLCNTSMGTMNMEEFICQYGFKNNEHYRLDKNSTITEVINCLDKKDKKS